MKAKLMNATPMMPPKEVIDLPDITPTPYAILDEETGILRILETNNEYSPRAYYKKKTGVLVKSDGKPVLEVKK